MEKNILIVDDEPSIIKVLDLFLKKEGFNIDSASSISETYKKLKKKEYSMIFLISIYLMENRWTILIK